MNDCSHTEALRCFNGKPPALEGFSQPCAITVRLLHRCEFKF